jgi:hypothetical protein
MRISKSNGAFCTPLHGATFHQKNRIFRGVEVLASLFKSASATSTFCLGHNPMKILVSAASQLEDILDGNPVRLQQANGGHKRIIVWLQRSQRNPSMFYTNKETKTGTHQ